MMQLELKGALLVAAVFLLASGHVASFYEQQNRLATEHALLDDNGDGLGTPASFFRGIHAAKGAQDDARLDGLRAHQVILFQIGTPARLTAEQSRQRDELERRIEQLRLRKENLPPDQYYRELEPLLIQLARLGDESP